MKGLLISNALGVCDLLFCIAALTSILIRKQGSAYRFLCLLLANRIVASAILLPLTIFGGHRIERHLAYRLYFFSFWISFAIESIFGLLLIYGLFNLAMAPLDGLKKLGALVFRWAASISTAIAVGSALAPHISNEILVFVFVNQLQRTQSILTLSLLLFVCFAIRPLGLTYSSRIFGVSLGLGLMAAMNLLNSAWVAHARTLFSGINNLKDALVCGVLLLWTAYFVLPEPKRRIIVLPTTSPFLRWNQISEVLGDAPGFVAIAGIPPELFAPAELEIMRRASVKMSDQPITSLKHSQPV